MGILHDNTNNDHVGHIKYNTGARGTAGRDGVGFKLTSNGNYNIDQKILRNVRVPNDVPDDSDYDSYHIETCEKHFFLFRKLTR